MKKHAHQIALSFNTIELLTTLVSKYINQCIRCNQCMDICPVTKDGFTLDELNNASKQGANVSENIKEFAFNCVQCGKCVPVCPMNIRRDHMVRYIKYKLREQKPKSYTRYLLIKGPNLTGSPRIIQNLFIKLKKITTRDLSRYMETTPEKKVDVLFYPGCYIYSAQTMRQSLRLLDHVGCSYSVLGGVTSCCGAPHLLQGELEYARQCLEELHNKITTLHPKIVITACAECYEALSEIKIHYNEDFEILTLVEYLIRFMNKFSIEKIRGRIMIHDSCRFTKESPAGVAARYAVSTFGELVEQESPKVTSCCYQWNHGYDKGNTYRRAEYLSQVKRSSSTLVCNCLTCYEEFKKIKTNVDIIDIIQLFNDSLDSLSTKE